MALITCPECQATISDKAATCVKCGAPVARGATPNATPVVAVKPPKTFWWYWWLWGPIGLLVAFILFGALIPKKVADANAFARACREMTGGDPSRQWECDRREAEIRYGGSTPSERHEVATEPNLPPSPKPGKKGQAAESETQGVLSPFRER